jgi:hypothetical protein
MINSIALRKQDLTFLRRADRYVMGSTNLRVANATIAVVDFIASVRMVGSPKELRKQMDKEKA